MPLVPERLRRRSRPRNPYENAPTGELADPLLPRWFVLLALASIPLAIVALVAALAVFRPADVPVAQRRPPPAGGPHTTEVGDVAVGDLEPVPYEGACPLLEGVSIAGTPRDRDALRRGLAALCNSVEDRGVAGGRRPPSAVRLRERLERFADAGGVVRFAVFTQTGVDSTATIGADRPTILVNNRYATTSPLWIAPLVAHDAAALAGEPGTAATELAATRAEDRVCRALLPEGQRSPACRDAAALLALDDPAAALREAGYR